MSSEERVAKILLEFLDVTEKEIIPSASIVDDLGADSLEVIELIMDLEEKFSLEIEDKEAEKLKTVQDIYDYVKSHN